MGRIYHYLYIIKIAQLYRGQRVLEIEVGSCIIIEITIIEPREKRQVKSEKQNIMRIKLTLDLLNPGLTQHPNL
jgi:hypothetical protein